MKRVIEREFFPHDSNGEWDGTIQIEEVTEVFINGRWVEKSEAELQELADNDTYANAWLGLSWNRRLEADDVL